MKEVNLDKMILKKSKQKEFLNTMKNEITAYLLNFKKRYQRFPWREINKISYLKKFSNVPITVRGKVFSLKELQKEFNSYKNKLRAQLKPSSFNYILKAYMKDSKGKDDKEIKRVYETYEKELQSVFNQMNTDLLFCLDTLKELNKGLKKEKKKMLNVKESKDFTYKDIFETAKKFILSKQKSDKRVANLEPLSKYMTHKSKKGETWLLIATASFDMSKTEFKKFMKYLSDNIKVDGCTLEFGSCYLPGDMFLYCKVGEVINEYGRQEYNNDDFVNESSLNSMNEVKNMSNEEVTLFDSYKQWMYVNESGDVEDLHDFIILCYESLIEDEDNDIEESEDETNTDSETVTEGYNIDLHKINKKNKKEFKNASKLCKKAIKACDYPAARKYAKIMITIMENNKRTIQKMKSDSLVSTIIGYFIENIKMQLESLVAMIAPVSLATVGTVTGHIVLGMVGAGGAYATAVVMVIKNIKKVYDDVLTLANELKHCDEITSDNFNWYKTSLIKLSDRAIKQAKEIYKHIDEFEDTYNKSKADDEKKEKLTKESAQYRMDKLDIYKACRRGDITIEEREELLEDLNNKMIASETVIESTTGSGLSKEKKFERVKAVLYEKCNNNEITVEKREELIAKARDMIFETVDPNAQSQQTDQESKQMENENKKIMNNENKNLANDASKEAKSIDNNLEKMASQKQ